MARVPCRRVRSLPAAVWTLVLPLMAVGLAACGGASEASTPTPSAATSSAPTESLIQQARRSCEVDGVYRDFAVLGDSGYTITMSGVPEDPTYANYGKVTGLPIEHIACILKALAVPDSVVSQMDATRAMDGMQKASWNNLSATWTYHPKDGFNMILIESK